MAIATPAGQFGVIEKPGTPPPVYSMPGEQGDWFSTNAPTTAIANRMDENAIRAQITSWAQLPGANPSLTRDPDYWVKRIKETGGLGSDNTSYWQGLALRPEGAPEGGGGTLSNPTGGTPTDFMTQDPGYQERFKMGTDAIQRSAAARGTLLTGGTLKELTRYGQDYATNEFGNVFNRNLSLAQLGENAAGGSANIGQNYAGQATNTIEGGGNAQAAGTVGSSNAWNTGLNTAANDAMMAYYLNWLKRQPLSSPTPTA